MFLIQAAILNFWNLKFISRVSIAVLFCFPVQNFTQIRQSTAELWPKRFWNGGRRPSSILKIDIFGHPAVVEFQMCCYLLNFIKIGWFFVDIWLFNDLQYVIRPPSCIFRQLELMSRDLCGHAISFFLQKFHSDRTIGRWVMTKTIFKMAAVCHLEF